jgi:tetratricopeptide (TPR) repeat protein
MKQSFLSAITIGLFAISILVCGINTDAFASKGSAQLIREGLAHLKAGRNRQAVISFELATRGDPTDAEAHFFLAVGQNRLGNAGEALVWIQRARAMGYTHPNMDLEEGVGLIGVNGYEAALRPLNRYRKRNPDNGLVRQLLGRANLGLARYDEAQAQLEAAIRLDPTLRETSSLLLGLVARGRGEKASLRPRLQALLNQSPDSPSARALQSQLDRGTQARRPGHKPWRISASAGGGFNDNVIGLGEGVVLPADISDEKSAFSQFTFNGDYEWRLTGTDTIIAAYAFRTDLYDKIDSADLMDHNFAVTYRRRFAPKFASSLQVSDQYSLLDGDSFRNQVTLRPSAAYRLADWVTAELAYSFAVSDYSVNTTEVQDRDSRTHTVAFNAFLKAPKTDLQGRITAFRLENNANGADFDFDSTGVSLAVSHPLVWGITGELTYTRSYDRYDNPNSLSGIGGFASRREDDADRFGVNIRWPVLDWARLYARYTFTRNDSNIRFFDYKQNVASAGIVVEY